MARTFAYCRVSTTGQPTENQMLEIAGAGFSVAPQRVVEETISGSTQASARPGFARLLERLEEGDILVCTKLDRLGRNAIDVRSTVDALAARGVRVHCLALCGVDLTSPAARMTMQVIAAVAEFERDLLVERTKAGLARAVAEGKTPGRRWSLSDKQRADVAKKLAAGAKVYGLAKEFGVSRQTIMRIRDGASPATA